VNDMVGGTWRAGVQSATYQRTHGNSRNGLIPKMGVLSGRKIYSHAD
jgi:hypothetical protein